MKFVVTKRVGLLVLFRETDHSKRVGLLVLFRETDHSRRRPGRASDAYKLGIRDRRVPEFHFRQHDQATTVARAPRVDSTVAAQGAQHLAVAAEGELGKLFAWIQSERNGLPVFHAPKRN